MTKHLRASQLTAGDTIKIARYGFTTTEIKLDEVHKWDAQILGPGVSMPAVVLLIFGNESLSIEPHEKFELVKRRGSAHDHPGE